MNNNDSTYNRLFFAISFMININNSKAYLSLQKVALKMVNKVINIVNEFNQR